MRKSFPNFKTRSCWMILEKLKKYRKKCIKVSSIVFAASKTTRLSSPASTPSDVVDLIITAAPTSCKRAMLPMITWIPVVVQQLQPIQTNSAHFPERPRSPRKDSRTVSAFLPRLLSYCYHSFPALFLSIQLLLNTNLSTWWIDNYYNVLQKNFQLTWKFLVVRDVWTSFGWVSILRNEKTFIFLRPPDNLEIVEAVLPNSSEL